MELTDDQKAYQALRFCTACLGMGQTMGIAVQSAMAGAATMAAIVAVQLGKDRESFLRICGNFYDVAKLADKRVPQ